MKFSILKRLEQLERGNLPKLFKPCLFLRSNAPEPENLQDYSKIIRTRVIGASNYQDCIT